MAPSVPNRGRPQGAHPLPGVWRGGRGCRATAQLCGVLVVTAVPSWVPHGPQFYQTPHNGAAQQTTIPQSQLCLLQSPPHPTPPVITR